MGTVKNSGNSIKEWYNNIILLLITKEDINAYLFPLKAWMF